MIEALQQSPALAVATALVLGLMIGSFLNVVIYRLPKMMEMEWEAQAAELRGEDPPAAERFDLLFPRSRCPSCGHQLGVLENVPLLSWLLQHGRCKACGAKIAARYPLVELATGLLSALAIWRFGATWAGLGAVLLGFVLIALTFIDLDTQLLPDSMTMPLLWLGLLFNLWGTYVPLQEAVIGAMAGYLSLWSVYWLFRIVTGKEGMGFGDFKLLAALGAWFGWTALPAIILLASVVGSAVGIALILFARHKREVPIPFGPYLAGAGLLALYLRDPLGALIGMR
ncbi:A24 family peptidase [Burkholderiaceae bacterium FT117]|uniref:prepilin peptidase n=1 Tax=Zeimonas sediminis TaxID=2944268 RepID=UPI002342D981|nr:A24 family peptidase [Zeimonas sediminis]MCM5570766.1 A24 family peptidase [Zeimonas sediminis]